MHVCGYMHCVFLCEYKYMYVCIYGVCMSARVCLCVRIYMCVSV